ncbi:MAG: aminoglycoside phosphotransferase family protein [Proteobacteria bacterium]|nr:aminoglycoside phosphotransferase family protein [Pseudomonadota bacterium]
MPEPCPEPRVSGAGSPAAASIDESELVRELMNRIGRNLFRYYPHLAGDQVSTRLVSHAYRSDNPLFLFKIEAPDFEAPVWIVAKHLLPGKTAEDAGDREMTMLNTLHGRPEMESMDCSVPRPLDHFPDLGTILMERVEGERLTDYMRRKNTLLRPSAGRLILQISERSGKCLRTIHDLAHPPDRGRLPETALDELFGKIQRARADLSRTALVEGRPGESVFRGLMEKAEALVRRNEFRLVRQHGDYYPGNILLQGRRLVIIDFAFSKPGPIHQDISRFLVTLDTLNPYPTHPLYDLTRVRAFKRRFLEGYFGRLDHIRDTDRLMIRLYRVRALLLHARRRLVPGNAGRRNRLRHEVLGWWYRRMLRRELAGLNRLL